MMSHARRRDRRRPDRVPARRRAVPRRGQRRQRGRRVATPWPSASTGFRAVLDDRSLATGLLAVQGPRSAGLLAPLTDVDLGALRYYAAAEGTVAGIPGLVARTGYTGEDGFEVFVDTAQTVPLVGRAAGRGRATRAGCRSASAPATRSGSRRACRCTATSWTSGPNPYEAGLGRVVKLGKTGDFVGRAALEKVARDGPAATAGRADRRGSRDRPPRLPGLVRRAARRASSRAGRSRPRWACRSRWRTSHPADAEPGTVLDIEIRDARVPARVVPAAVLQEGWLSAMVPTDLHYTKDHEWVRVEGDQATIGITAYAAEQLGDIVFVELPDAGRALEQFAAFGVVESVKAVSDLFAPVSGEVSEANGELGGQPRARQQRSVRRRLDDPGRPGRPGPGRRAARRRRLRRAHRGRLTADAVRSPHRRRPRADARGPRPDIGRRALRGHPGRAPGVPPGPARARAGARAGRPAQRAGRAQPDGPRLVPRGRRLPPLDPARGRPAPPARRVVHGLHAVPARDQPGHAPEHLRVRVAARRAGRPRRRVAPRTTTARRRRPRPP